MDKKPKSKSKIMKFLPRAASAVTFFQKPISPGKENRPDVGRRLTGPIKISFLPQGPRSKSNKSGYATPEPTSPKVSCIGQIKKKKKMKGSATTVVEISEPKNRQHPPSLMKRILTGGKVPGRAKLEVAAAPAVGLSQMKRFTSGRGALANFDWRMGQVAPADDVEGEETEGGGAWRSPVWVEEEVGPLQPRKEVNIWKRRTVVQPTPLQL